MNINISSCSVIYGEKKAVDNVSVDFEQGKVHVILGPNGCGKSTLIKEIVNRYADSGKISYVAQESLGNIALTTYEYICLGRYDKSKFFGGLTVEDRALIEDSIGKMGIEHLRDNIFDTLSGGEKQRAMIARALAQNADWILMDEPTASLDAKHIKCMSELINQLRDDGKSIIVVLHDLASASLIADRYVLMKEGKVIKITDELNKALLKDVYDADFEEVVIDGNKRFILV